MMMFLGLHPLAAAGRCARAEHKTSFTPHKKEKYYDNYVVHIGNTVIIIAHISVTCIYTASDGKLGTRLAVIHDHE